MSLLVWLPLIKNTNNQGVGNFQITATNASTYSAGKIGNALNFSNTYLTLNPAPLNASTKEFSFAFWYKPNGANSDQAIYVGRNANVAPTFSLWNQASNTFIIDDGARHTFNYKAVADTWQHLVFTRDESNIKLYVNGELFQTVTSTSFTKCGATTATIGRKPEDGSCYVTGQINDYRIYDHVLSVREIKELSKGLMTHLPLSWGANPNMIKNSYTWMNNAMGTTNGTSSTMVVTKSMITDDYAPCKNVLKVIGTNSGTAATGAYVGPFFGIGVQGLTTNDLVSGETYTYSFWAKLDSSSTGNISFGVSVICESQTHVSNKGFGNLTPEWRLHTVTFKWTSTAKLTACFYTSYAANSTATYYLCGIKLEKGAKATPYIPNVEEVAYTNYGYASKYYQDCSGYNRNVTTSGTLTIGTGSPRGTGTDFNKARIIVSDGFPVGTQTPFTIAYWHKAKTGTYTAWCDSIGFEVGNSSSTAASTQLRREVTSTTGNNYVWYGNGVVTNSSGMLSYTQTLDTWYHVVYTFDGTTFKQYINGSQQGTFTLGSDYTGFKTYPKFYVGDTGNLFEQCADVRVYATALSADDIKELYQIPAQIDKSGNMYCNNFVEE